MSERQTNVIFERVDAHRLRIPRSGAMRTGGVVYADHELEKLLVRDQAVQQVANVACLPGIAGSSLAMPDIHWGYGFPIGGVAAFYPDEGVISPGGVGYDINCGIRCIRTSLEEYEVRPRIDALVTKLYQRIPAGVGRGYGHAVVGDKELRKVLTRGAAWVVSQGLAPAEDLEAHEDGGCLGGADPDLVSDRARERGLPQLGTLGSGNHFLEIDVVEEILDLDIAEAFGLYPGQVVVLVHTGSRGLGYQVCDDALHGMIVAAHRYGIELPDRQLSCAPLGSREGKEYLAAMAAAANFAFANRELITVGVREVFEREFGQSFSRLGMSLLYDCCHNIAKLEEVPLAGEMTRLCVHRKGATRALPPGDPRLSGAYRSTGQPIVVPGDMGRRSYILAGAPAAAETFYSACHGAGRQMSRHQAKKMARGRDIVAEMEARGVRAMAASRRTLGEEIPEAYKDVSAVVRTMTGVGVARAVARLKPVGSVKG